MTGGRAMLFLATITNKAEVVDKKRRAYQAHIDYLARMEGSVLLSANMLNRSNAETGHLIWIIEAKTIDEAERIVRDDPYWHADIRQNFEIHGLKKAMEDTRRLI
jgi:uncharacterized protein YciI